MINPAIRKAALALVPLGKDEIRNAIRLARALSKVGAAHRPAAMRAARLLAGEAPPKRARKAKPAKEAQAEEAA